LEDSPDDRSWSVPERETRRQAAERELLAVREEVRQLADNMRARLGEDEGTSAAHTPAASEQPHEEPDVQRSAVQPDEELDVQRAAWQLSGQQLDGK
jgi:hypothetical protein